MEEFVNLLLDEEFICSGETNSCKKILCALSCTVHDCGEAVWESVTLRQLHNRIL